MGAAVTRRLIRRETRGDLPLLACLAAVVLVLTALCAWVPAFAGGQEDQALRQRVTASQEQAPLISLSTTPQVFTTVPPALNAAGLLDAGRTLTEQLTGPAAGRVTVTGGSYDYEQASLLSPRPPGPANAATQLALSYLPSARAHLHYVSGHPPADRTPPGTPAQVALSQASARALGVRAGSRLTLEFAKTPGVQSAPPRATLLVSGVYRTTAASDDFWSGRESLDQPSRYPAERSAGTVLAVRGLVGLDAADLLAGAGVGGPRMTWQLRADLSGAALNQARALTGPLTQYSEALNEALCQGVDPITSDLSCHVGGRPTAPLLVTDSLTPLLTAFTAQDQQARRQATFAVDALAAVALATVTVAIRLLLRRRQAHLRLQRARGASTVRLVLLRCAVAWPVMVIAALLGWAAGVALAPTGTSGSPQPMTAALATSAVALTLPLMTWLAVREPHRPGRLRRSRRNIAVGRRVVLELTVLTATAAGVVALRSQGPDGILGAVPVLVALSVVLILLRCYPFVLRLVLRPARRSRGAVGFLGAARAAHDAPATGLALFVLVLTLGTAVFGGLVHRTIDDGFATGAAWSTGADASATAAGTVTPAPGTRATGTRSALQHLYSLDLAGQADGAEISPVAVIAVDPEQLAAVAPKSPLAATLLARLPRSTDARARANAGLPSLLSPDLRARERTGGFTTPVVHAGQRPRDVVFKPVGTLTATDLRDPLLGPVTAQIAANTPLLITTADAARLLPPQPSGSTVLLLKAQTPAAGAPAALRAEAAKVLGPQARIRVRSETLNALRTDGLTRGLTTIYAATSILASLSGLLALVLELTLTSHERSRTTSFLRTLGLGGTAAGALHFLQLLPLALASAVGGILLGLLEPRLMAPTLDLRQFTGGPAQPALHTDFSLTVALVTGVTALILAAAVTEAVLARRRGLGAVLRLA
ncbi:putative ABC transport system permease protein [Streptomyces sp. TLI_55]|nr:putative ABC transport system permease protein [Streptomyces sp. TLI_55]